MINGQIKHIAYRMGEERQHPRWTQDDISYVESIIGAKLPDEFVDFVLRFGSVRVYTPQKIVDEYQNIIDLLDSLEDERQKGWIIGRPCPFVPIHDNESGAYRGFLIRNGVCNQVVTVHANEEGLYPLKSLAHRSFYHFIVEWCLPNDWEYEDDEILIEGYSEEDSIRLRRDLALLQEDNLSEEELRNNLSLFCPEVLE